MKIEENAKVVNCEFVFKCPQKWEGMQETGNAEVRFCGECRRNVYFAQNDETLRKLSLEGKCVAVFQQGPEDEFKINGVSEIDDPIRDFPRVTAGIPAMPEDFGKNHKNAFKGPETPEKTGSPTLIKIGLIIGLLAAGILGFLLFGQFMQK